MRGKIISLAMCLLIILQLSVIGLGTAMSDPANAIAAVERVLNSKYSRQVLPHMDYNRSNANVTKIGSVAEILRVGDIQTTNMFTIDFFLSHEWVDYSLQNILPITVPKVVLRGDLVRKLWLPDTIIRNSVRDVTNVNPEIDRSVTLYRNGTLEFTRRITSSCFCAVDLSAFPFDHQSCHVLFESMSYTSSDVVYKRPIIQKAPLVMLPSRFSLDDNAQSCNLSLFHYADGGLYSSFCVEFRFHRNPFPTLLRSYLPAFLIVLISWIGFYIDHAVIQARVFIPLTLVLSMITLGMSGFRRAGDNGQITADDIYQLGCYVFVFSGLLTFGVVHKIATRKKYSKQVKESKNSRVPSRRLSQFRSLFPRKWKARYFGRSSKRATQGDSLGTAYQLMGHGEKIEESADTASSDALRSVGCLERSQETETQAKREQKAHQIDLKARWLFPICFGVFNIIYWAYWIPKM